MNSIKLKKIIYTLLLCMICQLSAFDSRAAIPIKQEQAKKESATQKAYRKIDELTQKYTSEAADTTSDGSSKKSNDSGVFGILALTFGILGFFPLAIIFGIIGMEKHRKYRELAIAGLVIGLIYALIILLLIAIAFGLWASV